MGTVWRARDELLNRDVAIKEIIWPPDFSAAERDAARRRALREAQMAARLSHVNIVGIYDIIEDDNRPWIVMQFLPYRSLGDIVREDGPLPPAEAARLGLGILAALRKAHAEGVLHRDVKPANILVSPDGRAVLTDFGIARAADSSALTTSGVLVGSPSYIAPERARGEGSGPAGDLWGLGASLYTAVEGRPPFDRDGALATLTAVVADEPDPAVNAGALRPVISGLLRKDPARRLGPDETERMLQQVASDGGPRPRWFGARGRAARRLPGSAEAVPVPPPAPPEPAPPEPAPPEPVAVPIPEAAALPPSADPDVPQPSADPDVPQPSAEPDVPHPSATADIPQPSPDSGAPRRGPERRAEPASQPTAPIPIGSWAPRSPASRSPRRPSRRARGALAVAVAVIAASATGAALALSGSPGHHVASSATGPRASRPSSSPGASPSSPAAAHSSATSSSPAASSSTASSTPSGSATGSAGSGSGAVPPGYYRFTNSTGFSIGVPNGWQVSHVGHYVYVRDPANGGIFLLIDQSDTPNPNPLADWQQQEANRESTYPGYHRIRLESVYYAQAQKAADWEFTYDRDGVLVHVLNRNILANADHAYALYWSTPQSDWDAYYHYFQAFAATFQPAPA